MPTFARKLRDALAERGFLFVHGGIIAPSKRKARMVARLRHFGEEGQPFKLSVGVSGRVEHLQRPTTILLNARQQTVQAVMRQSRLLEVPIAPAGADPNATIN